MRPHPSRFEPPPRTSSAAQIEEAGGKRADIIISTLAGAIFSSSFAFQNCESHLRRFCHPNGGGAPAFCFAAYALVSDYSEFRVVQSALNNLSPLIRADGIRNGNQNRNWSLLLFALHGSFFRFYFTSLVEYRVRRKRGELLIRN